MVFHHYHSNKTFLQKVISQGIIYILFNRLINNFEIPAAEYFI